MRLILALLALLLLSGCEKAAPPRGSAQDLAATSASRAESNALAADTAAIDAASAKAKADELERIAVADPTPERIRAAADARVEAATTAAVSIALDKQARDSADEARTAAEASRLEREADDIAADLRRWVTLCRWIGLLGVAGGAAIGGLLCYFVGVTTGAPIGSIIAGTGVLVVAFGSTVTWLPLVLAAAVLVGLVLWGIAHQRSLGLVFSLSRTVDAQEGKGPIAIKEAKMALHQAVNKSGLRARLNRMRGKPDTTAPPANSPTR